MATPAGLHLHTTPGSQGCHGLGSSGAEAVDTMLAADLHFHILPGVDDGPADLSESLDLAWAVVDAGQDVKVKVGCEHRVHSFGTPDAQPVTTL